VGIVRINRPRVIYYNNERIKAHVFNVREKRDTIRVFEESPIQLMR
jgi:hypothetical protein